MEFTDIPKCTDGRHLRYASATEAINGKPLSEVLSNLQKLGEGMNDPLVYIGEMGDQIEMHDLCKVSMDTVD